MISFTLLMSNTELKRNGFKFLLPICKSQVLKSAGAFIFCEHQFLSIQQKSLFKDT